MIIITLPTLQGISQTVSITDTSITCLPNVQLRKMMRLNEIRKIQEKELDLVKEEVGLLEQKITIKDSAINFYEKRNKTSDEIISKYDSSVVNLSSQIGIHKTINDDLKRQVKDANRKRVLNKIFYGGIAAAALVLLAVK